MAKAPTTKTTRTASTGDTVPASDTASAADTTPASDTTSTADTAPASDTASTADTTPASDAASTGDTAPVPLVAIRMLVPQEGPTLSRNRGDVLTIGTHVDADEAQRLVDARFAEPA